MLWFIPWLLLGPWACDALTVSRKNEKEVKLELKGNEQLFYNDQQVENGRIIQADCQIEELQLRNGSQQQSTRFAIPSCYDWEYNLMPISMRRKDGVVRVFDKEEHLDEESYLRMALKKTCNAACDEILNGQVSYLFSDAEYFYSDNDKCPPYSEMASRSLLTGTTVYNDKGWVCRKEAELKWFIQMNDGQSMSMDAYGWIRLITAGNYFLTVYDPTNAALQAKGYSLIVSTDALVRHKRLAEDDIIICDFNTTETTTLAPTTTATTTKAPTTTTKAPTTTQPPGTVQIIICEACVTTTPAPTTTPTTTQEDTTTTESTTTTTVPTTTEEPTTTTQTTTTPTTTTTEATTTTATTTEVPTTTPTTTTPTSSSTTTTVTSTSTTTTVTTSPSTTTASTSPTTTTVSTSPTTTPVSTTPTTTTVTTSKTTTQPTTKTTTTSPTTESTVKSFATTTTTVPTVTSTTPTSSPTTTTKTVPTTTSATIKTTVTPTTAKATTKPTITTTPTTASEPSIKFTPTTAFTPSKGTTTAEVLKCTTISGDGSVRVCDVDLSSILTEPTTTAAPTTKVVTTVSPSTSAISTMKTATTGDPSTPTTLSTGNSETISQSTTAANTVTTLDSRPTLPDGSSTNLPGGSSNPNTKPPGGSSSSDTDSSSSTKDSSSKPSGPPGSSSSESGSKTPGTSGSNSNTSPTGTADTDTSKPTGSDNSASPVVTPSSTVKDPDGSSSTIGSNKTTSGITPDGSNSSTTGDNKNTTIVGEDKSSTNPTGSASNTSTTTGGDKDSSSSSESSKRTTTASTPEATTLSSGKTTDSTESSSHLGGSKSTDSGSTDTEVTGNSKTTTDKTNSVTAVTDRTTLTGSSETKRGEKTDVTTTTSTGSEHMETSTISEHHSSLTQHTGGSGASEGTGGITDSTGKAITTIRPDGVDTGNGSSDSSGTGTTGSGNGTKPTGSGKDTSSTELGSTTPSKSETTMASSTGGSTNGEGGSNTGGGTDSSGAGSGGTGTVGGKTTIMPVTVTDGSHTTVNRSSGSSSGSSSVGRIATTTEQMHLGDLETTPGKEQEHAEYCSTSLTLSVNGTLSSPSILSMSAPSPIFPIYPPDCPLNVGKWSAEPEGLKWDYKEEEMSIVNTSTAGKYRVCYNTTISTISLNSCAYIQLVSNDTLTEDPGKHLISSKIQELGENITRYDDQNLVLDPSIDGKKLTVEWTCRPKGSADEPQPLTSSTCLKADSQLSISNGVLHIDTLRSHFTTIPGDYELNLIVKDENGKEGKQRILLRILRSAEGNGPGYDQTSTTESADEDVTTTQEYHRTTDARLTGVQPAVKETVDSIDSELQKLVDKKTNASSNNDLIGAVIEINNPTELNNLLANIASGKFSGINTTGLTPSEVLEVLKQSLTTQNEAMSKDMETMLSQLANASITTAEDLIKVLDSLANILDHSFTKTIGGSGGAASGAFSVRHGTIESPQYTLVMARSTLTIVGKDVYIEGDIRPGKLQSRTGAEDIEVINDIVKFSLDVTLFDGWKMKTVNSPFENRSIFEPLSFFSLYGDTEFSTEYGVSLTSERVVLWNATVDKFSDLAEVPQTYVSFTSWLPITGGYAKFATNNSTRVHLLSGRKVPVEEFIVKAKFEGEDITIRNSGGHLQCVELTNTSAVLTVHGGSLNMNDNFPDILKKLLLSPIRVEGLDSIIVDKISNIGSYQMDFVTSKDVPMGMVTGFADIQAPEIALGYLRVKLAQFISYKKFASKTELRTSFLSGDVLLCSVKIDYDNGEVRAFSKIDVIYDGKSLLLQNDKDEILIEEAVLEYLDTGIHLTSGKVAKGAAKHDKTVVEVGPGQRIFIDGGLIVRNASDGYAIINGRFSQQGDVDLGTVSLDSSTLLSQSAQKHVLEVLENSENFIRNNGSSLTPEQQEQVAKQVLSMASSLFKTMNSAMANPSAADLEANLKNEKMNYNDLFNTLPKDRSRIRYIEEYTEEEWALEATQLIQQQLARQMAQRVKSMLSAVEDMLVATALKNGTLPYYITQSTDGNTLTTGLGTAKDLFKKPFDCNTWQIQFPTDPVKLDANITKDTLIRVSVVCYELNPYMYSDQAKYLVTSGCLDSAIKQMVNGSVIPVTNATEVIRLDGPSNKESTEELLMFSQPFSMYQILDVHTFHTTQWNTSIMIEYSMTNVVREFRSDIWVFVSFQRLPGPRMGDHDFRMKVSSEKRKNIFYIPASQLSNMTGLFYVGVGVIAPPDADPSRVAHYDPPVDYTGNWSFVQSIYFDYRLRAVTKGCYYFLEEEDRFDNQGMDSQPFRGDARVGCTTRHLTAFSVGAFAENVDSEFKYQYIQEMLPRNCLVIVLITCILIHQITAVLFNSGIFKNGESGSPFLHYMANNHPHDTYKYIVAVETGYKMFAQTDSKVYINIHGTDGEQLRRELTGDDIDGVRNLFRWGTTDRFVMTTPWSLGELEHLRVWIDNTGMAHRESWYCGKIVIKDLQTDKNYHFEVNNWMGMLNGDGETERFVRVTLEKNRSKLGEALRMANIAENLTYFAQYTGGGLLTRMRTDRLANTMVVLLSIAFGSFINAIVCNYTNFEGPRNSFEKSVFGFLYVPIDLLYGFLYALAVLVGTTFFPTLLRILPCEKEVRLAERKFDHCPRAKPKNDGRWYWAGLLLSVFASLILALLGGSMVISYHFEEEEQNCFAKRFFMMVLMWVLVLEPVKAVIQSIIYVYFSPDHAIITDVEKYTFEILPPSAYPPGPGRKKNDRLGKALADIDKVKTTKDARMRDEQLFETSCEILVYLASLFVLLGLTYFCRDRNGFFYQQQVGTLLSMDKSMNDGEKGFNEIRRIEDFWEWARRDLVQSLRVSWYDDQPAWRMRGFLNDKVSRSMGYGTIRQIRSQPNSNCQISDERFAKFFDGCEGYSDKKYEDRTPAYTRSWKEKLENVTDNMKNNDTEVMYIYRTAEELQGGDIMGYHDYYTAGGYAINLIGTAKELTDMFTQLEKELWIDQHTRAVIIEFSMYNAQANYFAVVQLLLESPPDGAWYPSSWIEIVRLLKYVGDDGKIVYFFECLYVTFALIQLVKELVYLVKLRQRYFLEFWNLIDFFIMLIACVSIYFYYIRYKAIEQTAEEFRKTNGDTYIKLDKQRDYELYFTWMLATVVLLVSLRLIRILRFNRRISVLAQTLYRAGPQMASFSIVFFIVNMAFNSTLYMLLFSKLERYRNMLSVAESSISGMLGKFVLTDLFEQSTLGSIVFIIFMLTGTVILINMFVMIVMYEFEEVRNDPTLQTNDYELVQHVRSKILRRLGCFDRSDVPPAGFPDVQSYSEAAANLENTFKLLLHRVENMRFIDNLNFTERERLGEYRSIARLEPHEQWEDRKKGSQSEYLYKNNWKAHRIGDSRTSFYNEEASKLFR